MTRIFGLTPRRWALIIVGSALIASVGSYGGLAGTFGAWMMFLLVAFGVARLSAKIASSLRRGSAGGSEG